MLFRRIKWASLLFVLLILFLQYRLWFDSGGIIEIHHLKKELSLQTEKNNLFKQRNDAFIQQIQSLQSDNDAMESLARQELGMIKKDEIFYQIVK